MTKISVGVLMGGMSLEKEVSFNSGRTICDHLDNKLYHVVPLFQSGDGKLYQLPAKFLCRGKISDFEHRLPSEAQQIFWEDLKQLVDIVFIAQHGRYGEDGSIQGMLEILKIPYVGSHVFASALGMDKYIQKTFLAMHGIKTAHGFLIEPDQITHLHETIIARQKLTYPLVVKPIHEGSSFGVQIVKEFSALKDAVSAATHIFSEQPQPVLIEEKIEGMEFSCIVLQDPQTMDWSALSVTEIVSQSNDAIFDYTQKYMPGRAVKWTPARASAQDLMAIEKTAIATAQALDFSTIARIDGFLTADSDIIIIDPNSLCGLAPSSFAFVQAAQKNMNHSQFINKLIQAELSNRDTLKKSFHAPAHKSCAFILEPVKKVIAVVLGGASNEREISLESGRNVIYKLAARGYQAVPLFLNKDFAFFMLNDEQLVLNSVVEIENSLKPDQIWTLKDIEQHADFVFIALHGGVGENGCLQGALELLRVPYNGSGILASALCMDKYKTTEFLKASGFSTPKNILVDLNDIQRAIDTFDSSAITLPLIIKPHNDGCSTGVTKIEDLEHMRQTLALFKKQGLAYALIEEYIQGMELTVGVFGNETAHALPASAVISRHAILSIEEKFLPGAGENQTPAPLEESAAKFVQNTIEQVYKVVGCTGYARIDCFYQSAQTSPTGTEKLVILEINTLPGLTPATVIFHQAAEIGMNPGDFLEKIIELGFEKHRYKKIGSATEALESAHVAAL